MNVCTLCSHTSVLTDVVPEYDADILGAPFKVVLRNAVKVEVCAQCSKTLNTAIPDPEGLLYAVTFARALHPRKLVGAEIKFIRNVMGWKSKRLAGELGITPEHMSRIENGVATMSVTTEKLFRIYSILNPGNGDGTKTPESEAKATETLKVWVDDLIEGMKKFKISSSWQVNKELVFVFERCPSNTKDGQHQEGDDGKWKPEKRLAA